MNDDQAWEMKKTAEECCEFATVLMQQLNKPHKDLEEDIVEELGDVIFRTNRLKKYYDNESIEERIFRKEKKEQLKKCEK